MPLVSVKIGKKVKKEKIKKGETYDSLLEKLGINREAVVIKADGKIVPESEKIEINSKLEIISIRSGG